MSARGNARRRLGWSTALGTSLLLLARPGMAQVTLPAITAGTVKAGAATIGGDAATRTVDLQAGRSVIEWSSFSIPERQAISFSNSSGGVAAVLNRVVGSNGTIPRSDLLGSLTAPSSVAVFLVNPTGILVGPSGAISAGSFFASTQGISDAKFATGTLQFGGGADGTLHVQAGAHITATGAARLGLGDLVLIGAQVQVDAPLAGGTPASLTTAVDVNDPINSELDQPGNVGIVAARDVTVATSIGGPLALTLTEGTPVSGAFKVAGTIEGRNVTLALATRDTVTDALLSVGGTVNATGASVVDGRVVLVADAESAGGAVGFATNRTIGTVGAIGLDAATSGAGGISLAAAGAITTGGRLDTTGTSMALNHDVVVTAGGGATIGADVASGGDLLVTGASVALGNATGPIAIDAVNRIDLTATTAGIRTVGAATLTANSGAAARDPLVRRGIVLDALNGDIALAAASLNATNYAVQLRNNPANSTTARGVTLGDVQAAGLTVTNARHGDSTDTTIAFTGATTLGKLTLSAATIRAAGDLAVTSLSTQGAATLTTSAGGGVTLGALTTQNGNGTVNAAGTAKVSGTVSVAGGYLVTGGTGVLLGAGTPVTQSASGQVTITATTGSVRSAAGGALTLRSDRTGTTAAPLTIESADIAAGAIDLSTAALFGGNGTSASVRIRSATATDPVTLGNVTALDLQGAVGGDPFGTTLARDGALTFGKVTLVNDLHLSSGSGALRTGDLSANAVTLASDGLLTTGAVTATGGGIGITGAGGAQLGALAATTITAGDIAVNRGGAVTIASLNAGNDVLIGRNLTPTTLSVAGTTNARDLSVTAGTSLTFTGAITATRNLFLQGGSVRVGSATAIGEATLSGSSVSATAVSGSAVTVTAGADGASLGGLTSNSGAIVVNGGGTTTVTGAVSAATEYTVTAPVVTLGTLNVPILQKADGAATITATAGTLTGLAGLTLQANARNTTGKSLSLLTNGTSGGDIAFAGTLLGGPGRQSAVRVRTRLQNNAVTLGDVRASTLEGAYAATDFVTGLDRTAALTLGSVDVVSDLPLATSGTLTAGALTASTVTLTSVGRSTVGAVTARSGAVTIRGSGALSTGAIEALDANAGRIVVDRAGDLVLAGLRAGQDIAIGGVTRATSVTLNGLTQAGTALTVSTTAAQSFGAVTAGTSATLTSGGTLTLASLVANGAASLTSAGLLATGMIQAGSLAIGGTGDLRATGSLTTATGGDLTIDRTGAVTLVTAQAGAGLRIGSAASPVTSVTATGSIGAGTTLAVTTSGAQNLGAVTAGTSTTLTSGGTLTTGNIVGGTDATLQGTTLQVASATATGGTLRLTATAGGIDVGALTAGQSARLTARDAVAVRGAVAVNLDYGVTGASVTLGNAANPALQRADRNVAITARTGTVAGAAGLTLRADDAGAGIGTLVLNGAGGIAFDTASRLEGGAAGTGDIGLRTIGTAAVTTGAVIARRLTGADANGALTTSLQLGGAVTLGGSVSVDRSLVLTTPDAITTGRVAVAGTGQALSLIATGSAADLVATDSLTAAGDLTLRAGRALTFTAASSGGAATLVAGRTLAGTSLVAAGNATLTADAGVTVATLAAAGGATVRGATVTLGSVSSSAGALDLEARTGDLVSSNVSATGAVRLAAAGDVAVDTGSSGAGADLVVARAANVRGTVAGTATRLVAGRDVTVAATGLVAADATGTRDVTIDAGAGRSGRVQATGGNAVVTARNGDVVIASLVAGGNAAVTSTAGTVAVSTLQAGGDAALRGAAVALPFGRVSGAAQLTSLVGDVTAADLTAGAVTIAANGAATLGRVESQTGALGITANGALTASTVLARGDGAASGATLEIESATSITGALRLAATAGDLRVGQAAAAGDVTLAAAGDVLLDSAAAGPTSDLALSGRDLRGRAAGARTVLAAGRNLSAQMSGTVLAGPVTAGGALQLGASSFDLSSLAAGSALLAATAGDAVADRLVTGGSLTLAAMGAARLVSINAATDLAVTAGTLDAATLVAGGAAGVTVTGAARLGTLQAGSALAIDAGTFTAGSVTGAGGQVRTRGGDLLIDRLRVSGDVALASAGAARLSDVASSGGAITLDAVGAVSLPRAVAATRLSVAGSSLDVGQVTAATVRLQSRSGALMLGNIGSVGDVQLDGAGPIVATGAIVTGGAARIAGGGDITLTTVQAGGDVAVAAGGSVGIAQVSAGGILGVTAGGDADLGGLTAGGAATVIAGRAARISGDVRAASYAVQGGTVALGSDAAVVQRANGAITVQATAGAVTGASSLTLRSDDDGDGVGDLTLRGTAGILFAPGSSILGGADRTAAVRLTAGNGAAIILDRVVARTVLGETLTGDATPFTGNGPVTITSLAVRDATSLTLRGAAADLTLGSVAADGDFTATADGRLTAHTIGAGGMAMLGGGSVALGSVTAATARIAATAGTLDLARLATIGAADLSAAGDVRLGSATAQGGAITISAGGVLAGAGGSGGAMLDAGDAVSITTGGAATIAGIRSAGAVGITAGGARGNGRIAIDAVDAGGPLTLASVSNVAGTPAGVALGRVTAGSVAVTTTGSQGAVVAGPITAGTGITFTGSRAVTLTDAATTGGAFTVAIDGALAAKAITASSLTINAGQVTATTLGTGAGALTLATAGDATFDAVTGGAVRLTAGGALRGGGITAAAADLRAAAVMAGSVRVDGGLLASVAGDATFTDVVAANATLRAGGMLAVGQARTTAGALGLSGGTILAATLDAAGTLGVAAAGAAKLGTLRAAADATLRAGGDLAISGALTAGGDWMASGATIALGGAAPAAQVAGGRIELAATGALTGAAGLTLASGTGGLSATAGVVDLAAATVDARGAGDLTFAATGAAAFGRLSAPSRSITITSADLALTGAVVADTVALANAAPAGVTRIGDGGGDNAAEFAAGGGGYTLDGAEIGRITAQTLVVDARGGAMRLGQVPLPNAAGSASVSFRGTGRLDVLGRLDASGSSAGRTIVLGGGAAAGDRAQLIRVASTSGGGGRLLAGAGTLDLRGESIGVGMDGGLLAPLGLVAGTPISAADAATRYAAQPNSSLYNSALTNALGFYTNGVTVQAGRLVVRYSNFALFQNTGLAGTNTGVVLAGGGAPALDLQAGRAANTFAFFGTVNGIGGNATSLLGNATLGVSDLVSRANSRANGCLIGASGGGCLAASLVQPTLNVFDTTRAEVFRSADDLTLPFDPLVGTSNEALFSDIASTILSGGEDACLNEGKTSCVGQDGPR